MFSLPELEAALSLVHESFPGTPQYAWPLLAERSGAEVWVKHENHTPTGAFKLRGGLIYAERLRRERPHVRGIVSATRGNHGQSLAWAGRRYGIAVTVVVPHGNSVEKNAAMRAFGARLIEHGDDFEMAREEAARLADRRRAGVRAVLRARSGEGCRDVFAGTVPRRAAARCAVCADRSRLRHLRRDPGARPARPDDRDHRRAGTGAPAYARSFEEGRVVALNRAETQADGVAVRQPDADAFAIIRAGASRIVTVSDDAIADAIRAYWTDTHNLVEGAGAAPLAALMQEAARMAGKRVGLVISGGNIDLALFRSWVLR